MSDVTRLSMWSGPRNISTAMMRSFGSRPDCLPVDEPFYAFYLEETGVEHPMRQEVLDSQPREWDMVVAGLNAPLPDDKSLLYVKHMTQHMLPQIDLSELMDHRHCFLIRDPRLVIASFAEKWDQVEAESTGFRQQIDLLDYFSANSDFPCIVIEGEDIQKNPELMLRKLCEVTDISFKEEMLSWEKGAKPEDGVWGAHWYNAVENSSGFAPYQRKEVQLSPDLEKLAAELDPIYQELKSQKITGEVH